MKLANRFKTFGVALMLGLFCIVCVSPAFGSKCRYPDFEDEYKRSAAVFTGEVLEETREGRRRYFTFGVASYWKGVTTKRITIYVSESTRTRSPYKVGERFLVFAKFNQEEDLLFDRRCSRSASLNGYSLTVKKDIEKLGASGDLEELEDN